MLKPKFHLTRLQSLVAILLILGILFRLINLDGKLYWYDETLTSLRISGQTQTELVEKVFDGRVITVKELQERYQYPNHEKGLNDAIKAFAGNAEHSPLYYLMARFWVQVFGSSVAVIRSLSAFISLLALPCIYWLCLELFESALTGWVAVLLLAISPFHVLYAQQARQYSLWTVAILLSSAALLRAMRLTETILDFRFWIWDCRFKGFLGWGIYAIAVAVGLYSHLFFGLVAIGHGIYVLAIEGFRVSKRVVAYLISSLVGLLLFSPWLWLIYTNLTQILSSTASTNSSVRNLPLRWLLNLSRLFFDFNQGLSWFNPIFYLIAILCVWAIYYLCRQTPQRTWLFILTLIGVTGIVLIVPDLILGGRRSSITRYAIACFLGIQLAVAYFIAAKIRSNADNQRQQKRWISVLIALLASGVLSCAVSSWFPIWWHNSHTNSKYNPEVADIVNRTEKPLLVTDEIPGRVLAFSHLLKPDVHLQLVRFPNIPKIPDGFGTVFLYRPSEGLKQNFQVESVYKDWLWKIK